MNKKKVGQVFESSPSEIIVSIDTPDLFDEFKSELQIGRYLKIAEGNNNFVVSQIQNIKSVQTPQDTLIFQISTRPIGMINIDGAFSRGSIALPVPTEPVYLLEDQQIEKIYSA